ncbi:Crp/Fnr family transcriptional regulator [Terriglobus sp.]|uniref:Crp/Fnr family transcriptional regulator n=1 Tax=Terriglobus sp. TaxID=1889013 RepID=UPI003B0096D3
MELRASNLLLDSLSPQVQSALAAHLEPVELPQRAVLYEYEETPRYVHLMLSGVASIVTTMQDGESVEVGVIGREGFPEHLHLLGPQVGATRCFMQVAGVALRMSFDQFREFFRTDREILRAVHRLVQHEALVLSQLGACNRLHEVDARLARWLLMVQDRTGEDELLITQEGLGAMIGSRRSTVNLAAGELQRAEVIDFRRGRVLIKSREALEGVACECYPILRDLYRALYQ